MYTKNRIQSINLFISQDGALEGVLPVYGKRGDKTQTWTRTDLDAGVSEFWVAVISRVDSNTRS